mmetsp:Transcript_24613/g.22370  ORF Transcript_24613/g.22370 Transcript_24613/m.22370 type:complete len:317 (-) Transcript_24613:33-983(-)
MDVIVAALYHFTNIDNSLEYSKYIEKICIDNNIKGNLIIAPEGINGTIAGSREAINIFKSQLFNDERFYNIEYKESITNKQPFYRLRVSHKQEIITMRSNEATPTIIKGEYVEPKDWNDLISDPNVLLIDTRNDYEIKIGKFKNAINPNMKTFVDFNDYVTNQLLNDNISKSKKIAMYCTGGIRCEKATSLLKNKGFENVYHLKGGILKYLEDVDENNSLWEGNCFVFDQRVSVKHNLVPANDRLCYACRFPLTTEDLDSHYYIEGVQCNHCYDTIDPRVKEANLERQKQMLLSKSRHEDHIGMTLDTIKERRRKH